MSDLRPNTHSPHTTPPSSPPSPSQIAAEHVEVLVTSLAIVLLLAPLVVFEILLTALARAASQKSSLAWSAVSERAHTNGWISGDRTSAIWLGIKRLLHQRRVGATGPEKEVVEEGGASEDGPEEIAVMGLSGENLEEEATALESNRPNGEPERPGAGLEGLSSERNETWGHLVPEIEAAYLPSTTQVSVLETITPLDTALEVAGGEPALLPTLEKHGVGPNHSFENPDYNSVKSGDSPSAVNLDGYPVTPVSSPTNICLPGFPPSPDSESSTEVVDAACTDDNASVSVTSSNDYSTMDSPKKKRKMTFSARAKTLFGSKPTMKV